MLDATARGLKRIETIEERRAKLIKGRNAGVGRQGPAKPQSFSERLSNPSSKLGSAVIGGGFPALMGGGPGTIAGGALGGSFGGFAGSIAGSAIGQFLDTAIQKVQELGNAINTLNFDKVAESGVRLTGELRTQLDLLVQVGQAQQAQQLLSQEVASVTGTPAGTTEDISNAVNLLNAAFNSVVSTVSTLLGILGAPFIVALAAALGLVSLIAKGINVVLGFVGNLIKDAGEFVVNLIGGEDAVRNLERGLAGVNGQFDSAIAKADQLRVELNEAVVNASRDLQFERRMTPGITAGEKLNNNDVELAKKLADLNDARLSAIRAINKENKDADLAVPGTIAGLIEMKNKEFDLLEIREKLVAARKAESIQIKETARLTSSLLQIEKDMYNVDLQRIALNVQQVRILSGPEASLQRQLDLAESKRNISIAMLRVEQDSALAEAAKLGTTAQVNVLYAAKLKLLNLQLSTEEEITEQTKRQLQLDKFIAAQTAVDTAVKPIQDFLADQEQELRLAKIYSRLLMEGVLPAEAQRQVNFEKIVSAQLRSLDIQIATTKATIAQAEYYGLSAAKVKELTEALINLEKARSGVTASAATGPGVGPTDRERLQTEADRVRGELNTLTDPINMITTAAAGIGDAFSTSFKGIISGSMTAKEALASFFTSVADMFLDMAAQIIAKMIQLAILNTIVSLLPGNSGGGLGSSQFKPGAPAQMVPSLPNIPNYSGAFKKRANGGPVSSGQTYMVGERGPELFVPGRSGTIVANDKMGGGSTNVVVNVDAKGSSVEGDAGQAKALGNAISAAVQSELIKQKRPGGLLA
jgi:hypothetical protein